MRGSKVWLIAFWINWTWSENPVWFVLPPSHAVNLAADLVQGCWMAQRDNAAPNWSEAAKLMQRDNWADELIYLQVVQKHKPPPPALRVQIDFYIAWHRSEMKSKGALWHFKWKTLRTGNLRSVFKPFSWISMRQILRSSTSERSRRTMGALRCFRLER